MRRPNQIHLCLAVMFLLAVRAPLAAQAPADQAPEQPSPEQPPLPQRPVDGPEAIRQDEPSFLVRVNVDRETRTYRKGDTLFINVTCEVDAFVYVIYKQADGKLRQIFPNSSQPDNRVRARQPVQIPARDDLFRFVIGAPFGKELVKVIASTEPIDPLAKPELRKAFFNPLSKEQVKSVEFALGDRDPAGWAEDQIEIVTQPRDQAADRAGAKRFGVFFGVANYEFNTEMELATNGEGHLNLPACHRDARQMAAVLHEQGQLSDVRVYTNDLATRANMEGAITRWLPSVSRPGDTVVIYFSGHGTQIKDDNGDEHDDGGAEYQMDELLVPYDYLGPKVLEVLMKRKEQGKLEGPLVPRVNAALATYRRAASPEQGIYDLVCRSAVSDDLFGHWLQLLSGRQVVVILDCCNSGGFAANAKGLVEQGAKSGRFDFLDQEVARLKDLGQRETALLAACRAQELSQVRLQGDLSVMTKYLLDSIVGAPRALTLEEGFQECQVGMHGYFDEVNKVRAAARVLPITEHRPFLVDYCAKPPLLKP
ncbi:MAG TPA: DUF4384 domain-containing protein [Pirellulales bacterium]|nr:DUF4384 domain-containing protein [Pirellulales bacterium]